MGMFTFVHLPLRCDLFVMWLPIVMRKQAAVMPTFPLHGSHYVTCCIFTGCAREREMVYILITKYLLPRHSDFY